MFGRSRCPCAATPAMIANSAETASEARRQRATRFRRMRGDSVISCGDCIRLRRKDARGPVEARGAFVRANKGRIPGPASNRFSVYTSKRKPRAPVGERFPATAARSAASRSPEPGPDRPGHRRAASRTPRRHAPRARFPAHRTPVADPLQGPTAPRAENTPTGEPPPPSANASHRRRARLKLNKSDNPRMDTNHPSFMLFSDATCKVHR